MAEELRLEWEQVASGLKFHAGLVRVSRFGGGYGVHTHDFGELMYVLDGQGTHLVNGAPHTLSEGDLALIRPPDRHTIRATPGEKALIVNVAYPVRSWQNFIQTAGLESAAAGWERVILPPLVQIAPEKREAVAAVFHRALRVFQDGPSQLELCRFYANCLPLLLEEAPNQAVELPGPAWLNQACRAMRDGGNLRVGLPRLIALSGVSAGHLSRTLKQHRNQTPGEFVNELRLTHAALLLTVTPREIMEIADACGFNNLSYFYRLFRAKYDQTPRDYRLRAQKLQGLK